MAKDKSNGYVDIATIFIKGRGQAYDSIGASSVGGLMIGIIDGSASLSVFAFG